MTYAHSTLAEFARLESLETLAERASIWDEDDTTAYVDRLSEDEHEQGTTGVHMHWNGEGYSLCTGPNRH